MAQNRTVAKPERRPLRTMQLIRADPSMAAAAVVLGHILLLCTAGLPGSAATLLDRTTAAAYDRTPTTVPPGGAEGLPSAGVGIRDEDVEPLSPAVQRGQWVQRVRPIVRNRSLHHPAPAAAAATAKGGSYTALPLGRVIANVLYGAPWPVPSRVNSKCVDDVRIYNNDLQNFTLWAAKSE